MITTYPIQHIVSVARQCSSFYKKLYRDLPESGWAWDDLPIVPFDAYQKAIHDDFTQLLTTDIRDGILSASSGTTGVPKLSITTREEWETFNTLIALRHWENNIIKTGDIIANVTMAGRTRLSFLAVTHGLQASPVKCVELPISGTEDTEFIVNICRQLKANVLAGLSLTLINIAYYIHKHNITDLNIDTLLYGGEIMYGSQLDFLKEIFPKTKIISFLYGSNETGLAAYSDNTCNYNEHVVHKECCVLEMIDLKTGKVINEPYQEGAIVVTSLSKLVMPAIRCPIGDKGMWIDPPDKPNRRFIISERIFSPTQVGDVTFTVESIKNFVNHIAHFVKVLRFQMILKANSIILNIACPWGHYLSDKTEKILEIFHQFYPQIKQEKNLSVHINFVEPESMITTNRSSGKHKVIIDES